MAESLKRNAEGKQPLGGVRLLQCTCAHWFEWYIFERFNHITSLGVYLEG